MRFVASSHLMISSRLVSKLDNDFLTGEDKPASNSSETGCIPIKPTSHCSSFIRYFDNTEKGSE